MFCRNLDCEHKSEKKVEGNLMAQNRDIAVIAMNCRFPGAGSVEEFWEILCQGRAPLNEVGERSEKKENSIPINVTIKDADKFDAVFFNYTGREAEIMDPQVRLFLHLAWEVFERAGYNPFNYEGLIGAFAGASMSSYLINQVLHHSIVQDVGEFQTLIYNEKDYLTSLLAYHLDIKGPCVTVQTSCSTSLVAIHMACESLVSGQCDMALAGGVTLSFPDEGYYFYKPGGLLSQDGRICAFDQSASGTVYSNGAGLVLLKRHEDAVKDGDSIIAVIKGTAINNDGSKRNGFYSPAVEGQSLVIAEALSMANINPETIGYIEAHGSGTSLGDAIEFNALKKAFEEFTQKKEFCALGSVKTNVGHTQMASGIAGFIKTCLCLKHAKLVPSLNYNHSNEKNDFSKSPFFVSTDIKDWVSQTPRRAGINSFGLGGANTHIVLEESPYKHQKKNDIYPEQVVVSARTDTAFKDLCKQYYDWLKNDPTINLNDFAFTSKVGRYAFPYRVAFTFSSLEDLLNQLKLKAQLGSTRVETINSISASLRDTPLFSMEELYWITNAFEAFKDINEEIYPFLEYRLEDEERCCLIYSLMMKLLSRMGILIDCFLVEGLGQRLASFISPDYSLDQLIDYYRKDRQRSLNEIEVVEHSIDARGVIPFSIAFKNDSKTNPLVKFYDWNSQIWLQGIEVNWSVLRKKDALRILLPTYPFEMRRFFVEELQHSPQIAIKQSKENDIESMVRDIWKNVMGVELSSLSDNFFEMGGHSLLATQLLYAIEQCFNKRISMRDFLDNPSAEGLVDWLENHSDSDSNLALPEIILDPSHRFDPFPLTDIQQAYWIGRQSELDFGNISTHMYFEKDIRDLDLLEFQLALNFCIQRHDMLRAIILEDGTQRILKTVEDYEIESVDLIRKSEERKKQCLDLTREKLSHEIMNPTQWPLFKIKASKISEHVTRLHISIDLLILDAWSIEVWLKEIGDIYANNRSVFQPLKLTFRDYVLTLKKIETSPLYERAKQYWLERVKKGLFLAPQLPLQMKPSDSLRPHFRRYRTYLSKVKWESIKRTGKALNLTSPVVLIGAFCEVLRRWSTNPEFTLNLTMFNRLPLHPEVEQILGDFTSLTLLEISNSKNSTFLERLTLIQQRLWEDLEHRYFSGPRVTRELLKHHPFKGYQFPIVFTSLLNQEGTNSTPFEQEQKEEDEFSISQTPQVWLDHQVIEHEDGIYCNWDVIEGLFPEKLVESMFSAYFNLLEDLSKSSSIWQKQDLFTLQSNGFVVHQIEDCHSRNLLFTDFLKWSEKTPQQVAIFTLSKSLTYGELAALSQNVAGFLASMNLELGELVAVVMDKGWEMVTAQIGILLAGGAYLPIDGSYPKSRIEEMLVESKVKKALVLNRNTFESSKMVEFFSFEDMVAQTFSFEPKAIDLHQLAYAFFTSGSAGKPKCVEVSHFSAVNTINAVNKKYHVNSTDAVLALSNFSFDLSVYDLFGLLGCGGKIVIPVQMEFKDPQAWVHLISNQAVTIWNTTPALMQMIHSYVHQSSKQSVLSDLRLVLLSGDKIPVSLALSLKNEYQIPDVVSLGGATEAAIWSIWYDVKGDEHNLNSIPYGFAMPSQSFYVLNEALDECPMWVEGELFIGGVCLAKGYRNNEVETQFRFIDHPKYGRIYRTGDRGRFMYDGSIEFLGRQDNQVKIRGHRVELSEIEAKLNQHPWVRSSIAIFSGAETEEKELGCVVELQSEFSSLSISNLDPEIITNPIERLQFKISERGIRHHLSGKTITFEQTLEDEVKERFIRRRSTRIFSQEATLTLDQLNKLLSNLRSIHLPGLPFGKRLYGSGGGLYPIQVYVYVKKNKVHNLEPGIYYYHPKKHSLILIHALEEISDACFPPNNRKIIETASIVFFLIADYEAIIPMYGKTESQHLVYLEGGLISQLFEMKASEYNFGLCQIGGIHFEPMKKLFLLDGRTELIQCLAAGPITDDQLTVQGIIESMNLYHSNEKAVYSKELNKDPEVILKDYLKELLPDHMIPNTIHFISAMPLTTNGKVDRRACEQHLQKLAKLRMNQNITCMLNTTLLTDISAEQTLIEDKLINIWQTVLKGVKFTSVDNFFDVGGNSISLVHIYRLVQEQFNVNIDIVDLFKYPTIRLFTQFINQKQPITKEDTEATRSQARQAVLLRKKESRHAETQVAP